MRTLKTLRAEGITPKEAAYADAIEGLRRSYTYTQYVEEITESLYEQKLVRRQLAILHNRLLRQSNMDGIELEEEVKELPALRG